MFAITMKFTSLVWPVLRSITAAYRIDFLHSEFKRWIITFNGVSSKYVFNYLAWLKFIQLSKKNKKSDQIKDMLINSDIKDTCITRTIIKNIVVELA